ncbi:MAG: hypothetical protein LC112_11295 [Flavobacteriales bacterium]|nr:hypothetical protein [Flavobacteriales bacterium]
MIKAKLGICIDCHDNGIEKPLTAKRCFHHYWIHRAEVNAKKNAWKEPKRKEIKSFLDAAKQKKPIERRSKRRKIQELQYNADVKIFLAKPENKFCPVTGKETNQVHHKKGRIESLLLDQRFWLAVSDDGHREIELNPDWAKEKGYSLSRLATVEN